MYGPRQIIGGSIHNVHIHFAGRGAEVTHGVPSPLQAAVGRGLTGEPASAGGMQPGASRTLLLNSRGSETSSYRVWTLSN